MSKHTPGPWELQKPLFGEQHIYVHSENSINGKVLSGRQHICVVPYEGKRGSAAYHEMFNANARLIAAAPDLLEALRLAEAALADIGDADREPGDNLAWCEARAAQDLPAIRAAIAKAEGQ